MNFWMTVTLEGSDFSVESVIKLIGQAMKPALERHRLHVHSFKLMLLTDSSTVSNDAEKP